MDRAPYWVEMRLEPELMVNARAVVPVLRGEVEVETFEGFHAACGDVVEHLIASVEFLTLEVERLQQELRLMGWMVRC